ncbi:MAG TPA: response regulator [Blastocatellia bacterium]|nr:response regulator [Blastocatellia bacterium]
MNKSTQSISILMADDDADDCLLIQRALAKSRIASELRRVEDGEELMDYLFQRGKFAAPGAAPRPELILLDLNMPRKDGREALGEIKSNPQLRCIPVVVLTTSRAEEDIYRSYNLGANSYITKPVTFERLVELMDVLGTYWADVVELPETHRAP